MARALYKAHVVIYACLYPSLPCANHSHLIYRSPLALYTEQLPFFSIFPAAFPFVNSTTNPFRHFSVFITLKPLAQSLATRRVSQSCYSFPSISNLMVRLILSINFCNICPPACSMMRRDKFLLSRGWGLKSTLDWLREPQFHRIIFVVHYLILPRAYICCLSYEITLCYIRPLVQLRSVYAKCMSRQIVLCQRS